MLTHGLCIISGYLQHSDHDMCKANQTFIESEAAKGIRHTTICFVSISMACSKPMRSSVKVHTTSAENFSVSSSIVELRLRCVVIPEAQKCGFS